MSTIEHRGIISDERLSLRAKGLYLVLAEMKSGEGYTFSKLQRRCREGRDALRGALSELETCGWIERIQPRELGRYNSTEMRLTQPIQEASDK